MGCLTQRCYNAIFVLFRKGKQPSQRTNLSICHLIVVKRLSVNVLKYFALMFYGLFPACGTDVPSMLEHYSMSSGTLFQLIWNAVTS